MWACVGFASGIDGVVGEAWYGTLFFLNTTLLAAFRGHPVDCHTTDY